MSKIFMSYRRKSWPFTDRLADELRQRLDAEIFVDFTGIDEADFERCILRNLRESDAVLLVVSDLTFTDRIHRDDDWVRREIREALTHNKPLILVCIDGLLPPPGLPDDIKDVARMQGINFYSEYFTPAVERLAEFIIKVGAAHPRQDIVDTAPDIDEKSISGRATLDEALDLLQAEDFHKAIFLLEALQNSGYKSRYVDLNAVLQQARLDAEQADTKRQAALDYAEIVAFARRKVTEAHARTAFEAWRKDFPDLVENLDTENLRERFKPASRTQTVRSKVYTLLPPPFEWIEIPAGTVTLVTEKGWEKNYIPEGKSQVFDVPAFAIAKYPTTNAQYAKFVEAGGYKQKKWWTAAGWQVREKEGWTEPHFWQDNTWNGADQPVVGVSWYEAAAFCLWLSETSGEKIMLPTEQQWQRAAQGDDNCVYPWGNEWDGSRCNNSAAPFKSTHTTPVQQYEGLGDSPFGVVDLAGNVWEWCLTAYQSGSTSLDGTDVRVLRGGSWSDYHVDTFRVSFRDGLNPHDWAVNVGFRCARSAFG